MFGTDALFGAATGNASWLLFAATAGAAVAVLGIGMLVRRAVGTRRTE